MPLFILIGETAYQPISTGVWFFFFNVTMFPIRYSEYDCNTACQKKVRTIVH